MDIKEMTAEALLFHYITTKEQVATLNIALRQIEEELKNRKKIILERGYIDAD